MESCEDLAKFIMELQETFLDVPLGVVLRLFGRLWSYLCRFYARRAMAHPTGLCHGLSARCLLHHLDNWSIRLGLVREKTSIGVVLSLKVLSR